MPVKYALSKYFAKGHGHVIRPHNCEILMFQWNGKPDGTARYSPHVKLYARAGVEHRSLAALLRAVEAEHVAKAAAE